MIKYVRCLRCEGTGEVDSGAMDPQGYPINLVCPDCEGEGKTPATIEYKTLAAGGQPCNGGRGVWNLPTRQEDGSWLPGEWMPTIDVLEPCRSGYHLSLLEQIVNWFGPFIYIAEHRGSCINTGDKLVAGQARLLEPVTGWNENTALDLARWCALDLAGFWDIPDHVKTFLQCGDPKLSVVCFESCYAAIHRIQYAYAPAKRDPYKQGCRGVPRARLDMWHAAWIAAFVSVPDESARIRLSYCTPFAMAWELYPMRPSTVTRIAAWAYECAWEKREIYLHNESWAEADGESRRGDHAAMRKWVACKNAVAKARQRVYAKWLELCGQ